MPVLKSETASSATKDAIVLDMGDLRRQADQLRQVAQQHAQKLVHEAKQQSADIAAQARAEAFEQGYREGFEKGEAEGREKGHAEALVENRQKLTQLQEVWETEFAKWDGQREAMETDAKHAVLKIGSMFGQKIVHRVVAMDPAVVLHQLTESLGYVLKPSNVTIKVNPTDRPMIEDALPQLLANLSHLERVRVDDDATISPGGCIIDFGKGRIDSTVDKQLDRLVQTILPDGGVKNHVEKTEPLVDLTGAISEQPSPDQALDQTPDQTLDQAPDQPTNSESQ